MPQHPMEKLQPSFMDEAPLLDFDKLVKDPKIKFTKIEPMDPAED